MTPLVRLIKTFAAAVTGRSLNLLDVSIIHMRVWPNDLDPNLHMNNGRFLTLMDLGRFDLILRTGLGRICLKNRWRPLVGSVKIQFRRSIGPFKRFELKTRILSWDDKWIHMEQCFITHPREAARARLRFLFSGPNGKVPTSAILKELNFEGDPPPIPDEMNG